MLLKYVINTHLAEIVWENESPIKGMAYSIEINTKS